jgi:three-Cys-motif partner protein
LKFDEIGYWSEIKLQIIQKYAAAYSKILAAQTRARFHRVYIDAFAGAGVHVSKKRGTPVPGSPLNALAVEPPFQEYYLIDLDSDKADHLRELVRKLYGERDDVHIYTGDCNDLLLQEILPRVDYRKYERGLCLLDPYGLQLDWQVIKAAGHSQAIDLILNFPVMDMNRNVLWRNPEGVEPADLARMNAYWGDDSWRRVAYVPEATLFGVEERKANNEDIAEGFRARLKSIGGFKYVPEPMPMRNSTGAVVYYLFFASQVSVAGKIASEIFASYR